MLISSARRSPSLRAKRSNPSLHQVVHRVVPKNRSCSNNVSDLPRRRPSRGQIGGGRQRNRGLLCLADNDESSPELLGVASNSRGPRAIVAPFAAGCKDLAAPVPQGTAPIPGRP